MPSSRRSAQTPHPHNPRPPPHSGQARLLITGLALSIDNLAVGFALGTYHVTFALAAIIIGAVSVTMSLAGLELGNRIGSRTGKYGEVAGGIVLIAVGAAIGSGIL